MKNRSLVKNVILLQAVIVIYTISSVFAKLASTYEIASAPFLIFMVADFLCLAVYALLWQQMIKRFELSIAYANRSVALLWSMIWSALLFKEGITVTKLLGVALVIAGTLVINGEGKDRKSVV